MSIMSAEFERCRVTKRREESEMPGEILTDEILPRLPAKSLMRFKLVNKSWLSLIRDSHVAENYQRRHPRRHNHTHLLLTASSSGEGQHFFSAQINPQGQPTQPTFLFTLKLASSGTFCFLKGTHSVNGLILITDRGPVINHIVNPCTRQVYPLPKAHDNLGKVGQTLRDVVVYRLGFSDVTKVYKVLRVHQLTERWNYAKELGFQIFTLNGTTRSWRNYDCPFSISTLTCDYSMPSVSLHGGIHWIHKAHNVVVVFDVGDEGFRSIQLPRSVCEIPNKVPNGNWGIIQVNGCIAVYKPFLYDRGRSHYKMKLWILEDYKNHDSWIPRDIVYTCLEDVDNWKIWVHPFGSIDAGDRLVLSDSDCAFRVYDMEIEMWDVRKTFQLPKTSALSRVLTSYEENIRFII